MRREAGFTLVELMVVIAVIAVIAAIAIPNLLSARKAANEAGAISNLRTISTCCEQYKAKFDTYPLVLGDLVAIGSMDAVLGSGSKSGYLYGTAGGGGDADLTGGPNSYICFAEPTTPGITGDRLFRVDEDAVIEESNDGGATWAPVPK